MTKTAFKNLLGSCICASVSLALLIVGLSTDGWVTGSFRLPSADEDSEVTHGLFTGSYTKRFLANTRVFPITLTCLIGENVCAWSCLDSAEKRENEVEALYNNKGSDSNLTFQCVSAASTYFMPRQYSTKDTTSEGDFLSAGLWISTILFLSVAILANLLAVGFNIWNLIGNPIETYASVFGLYIYLGVAACSSVITLALWGAQFGIYSSNNIGLSETIYLKTETEAEINYSYILVAAALWDQLVAIGILYYRQYLINREEAKKVIKIDQANSNDANPFMY